MDAQELQNPENLSTIWVKNLGSIVNKMNNTKSLMIGMKANDAVELDIEQNISRGECTTRRWFILMSISTQ